MSVTRENNQQTANPVENAAATSLTSNAAPTGVMKGDVLVAVCAVTGTTITSPGAFTRHINNFGTNVSITLDYLVVGDPAALTTYTWSAFSTSSRCTLFLTAFRGVNPFTPFDATGQVGTNTGSGSNCVISAITTVSDNCMLVAACGGNAATGLTWTQPSGFTQVATSTGTGRGSAYASDAFQTPAGSTGTKTYTWSQTNLEMRGVMGALRPAPGQSIVVIDQAIIRRSRW